MLLLLISVSLVNLIVSPVYGLITIESQPAKVAYGSYVQLVCDVGTMINTVKWVYGGVTYYSCSYPYTNCSTNTNVINDGIYFFSIKDDSVTMILVVSQYQNDYIWSCYHGNDKADIDIDNADAPIKPSFRSSRSGDNYLFECSIESKVPADVVIYSHTYLGIRKLYEMNQTIITDHSITTSVLCADYKIFCSVSNGYGPPVISDYTTVVKNCPLKVLDTVSNPTWVFNEIGKEVEFKVYYEGYPDPSYSLHRFTTNGIQEVSNIVSLYAHSYPTVLKPRYISITFHHPEESDAGKYILTLKQNTQNPVVMKGFLVPLVYTGKSTSNGSDQPPPTTTTNGSDQQNTTTNGSKQQNTTTNGSKQQNTTTNGSDQQNTTTNGSKQQNTTTTGSKQQNTTTNGSDQQNTTTNGSKQQNTTTNGSDQQNTTTNGSKQQNTTNNGSKQQNTTTNGSKQQNTTTNGSDQQNTTTNGSDQQNTTTNGSDQQTNPTTPTMTGTTSSGGMVVGKTKAETMIIVCIVYLRLSVYFGSIV